MQENTSIRDLEFDEQNISFFIVIKSCRFKTIKLYYIEEIENIHLFLISVLDRNSRLLHVRHLWQRQAWQQSCHFYAKKIMVIWLCINAQRCILPASIEKNICSKIKILNCIKTSESFRTNV